MKNKKENHEYKVQTIQYSTDKELKKEKKEIVKKKKVRNHNSTVVDP